MPLLRARVVEAAAPEAFAMLAKRDPRVRYVEPLLEDVQPTLEPNDPLSPSQQGARAVRAPAAWDLTTGTTVVSLCVIDSGVRYTHEDVRGPRWLGGIDLANQDADPWDDYGHGTHVAGIAAATLGNGAGIAGMAQAGVRAAKVLRENGAGSSLNVALGILWCAESGSRILVLSLSTPSSSAVLRDAVQYASLRGALLVASAGNNGPCEDCVGYPARYPEVLAVACVDAEALLCEWGSTGPETEVAAPGVDVLSLSHDADDAYVSHSGTSMSVPHVAGAAALLWSERPQLSAGAVRVLLGCGARDLGEPGRDSLHGYGLLDARRSLDLARAGATGC
ncbi:MAG TPA: S8 family serine peptidase [Candidatus Thermoplasmatota archaeon]|nr:S8 family serine peptidase [Candidatus Thermoplasmatota archaeon]